MKRLLPRLSHEACEGCVCVCACDGCVFVTVVCVTVVCVCDGCVCVTVVCVGV